MKNQKNSNFRSTIGRVRALGAAKSGTHHWMMMHVTSVALVLLALYPLFGFFIYAVYGGRAGALAWLHSPLSATGVVLFLMAGFHHAANGLQAVIEDYVHCPCAKTASLYIVKGVAAIFALLGVLSTLKILFGV